MADYFTNFSLILELNQEQREYALNLAEQVEDYWHHNQQYPTTFPDSLKEVEEWPFKVELIKDGIWLHSESGGQDIACLFIQHLLQRFNFAAYVTIEWSHDCTKPRPDAFGGGAAYITADQIETFSTSSWLHKMIHG